MVSGNFPSCFVLEFHLLPVRKFGLRTKSGVDRGRQERGEGVDLWISGQKDRSKDPGHLREEISWDQKLLLEGIHNGHHEEGDERVPGKVGDLGCFLYQQ